MLLHFNTSLYFLRVYTKEMERIPIVNDWTQWSHAVEFYKQYNNMAIKLWLTVLRKEHYGLYIYVW